ncbi:hypothetical protein IE4872_CH01862 [Rhizobium gallicum]|uniref:Uncharacterized protein n=1 Tax=Rhizobium gallicum TaxID=56730 RepID=A0A1L5NHZ8_9HYPH|nr:hypothetical protein IE4872_CH01862 [Rhizobium gallicum]
MQRHSPSKPSGAALMLFETEHLKANIRADNPTAVVRAAIIMIFPKWPLIGQSLLFHASSKRSNLRGHQKW